MNDYIFSATYYGKVLDLLCRVCQEDLHMVMKRNGRGYRISCDYAFILLNMKAHQLSLSKVQVGACELDTPEEILEDLNRAFKVHKALEDSLAEVNVELASLETESEKVSA